MANEFIIRKGYKSLANSEITGSLNVTGDITGSAFKGDGSALTGITAEWDGSHTGNASITGKLQIGNYWDNSNLNGNSIYVQNATDGFAFGVGTGISTWFSYSNTGGQNRMIDVDNDGTYILLRTGNINRVTINSTGATVAGELEATSLDINGAATFDTNVTTGGFITHKNSNAGNSAYTSLRIQSDVGGAEIWRNSSTRTQTGGAAQSFNIYNDQDTNIWSGGTRALHLDTSQNASFAGNATFAGDARFNSRVRIGDVTGLSNRGTVRIDTRGDVPADLLFGRDTDGTATSWNEVFWGISSRGSNEGNTFKIYRGTAHSSPYNTEAVPFVISPNLNASFANNVNMASGNVTGKFAVKSTGVHASYDFYNNGTSYFNSTTIVDGAFTQSGGLASTFSGNVTLGDAATDKTVIVGNLGIGPATYPKVVYPGSNAQWGIANNSTTGQVVIDLPGTLANYDMMYMEIDIYEYSSENATKLIIGGHNWNSGGDGNTSSTMWHNVGVTVLGTSNKSVYFGWRNDGTNNRRVIAIGEVTSTWNYGTVHVAKVSGQEGYATNIDWVGDWGINLTTSTSYFTKNPTTNYNSATATTFKTTGKIAAAGATFTNNIVANGVTLTGNQTLPTDFVSKANGGTFSGDIVVEGSLTAREFHTEFVSASIMYDSGSTKFGDTSDDTHDFTGSVNIDGAISADTFTGKVESLHEWEWYWVRYADNVTVATDTQANWEAAYKTYFIDETATEQDEGYVNTIDDVGADGGFGGSTYGNIFGNLSSYHTLITTNIHVTEPFTVSITDFSGDDSHAIFIDGAYVKGVKACCSNSSYSYTFTQGWHRIDLIYGEGGGGDFIKMGWNPKDYTDNISNMYAHLGVDNPNYTLEKLKAIDGAGSGLDADLLDGQEGSHYLDYNNFGTIPTWNQDTTGNAATATTATTASNAMLLDGLDSTAFSLTGDTPLFTFDSTANLAAPDAESGTWTDGNSSNWGHPRIGTSVSVYNDSNGQLEFNVPTGIKTAYISHLTWDSGGYMDVYGKQADGDLVFLRRINTKQTVENSNHGNTVDHDGATIVFAGHIGDFPSIRIINKQGRAHLTGLGWSKSELVASEGTGIVNYSQLTGTVPTWNQDTTGNADTATSATTATRVTINSDFSGTYPMLVEVEASGDIYNNPSVTYNGTTDTLTSPNFAGNLTGNATGNAGTVTNGVYTTGNQTIAGDKTFSGTLEASGTVKNVLSQHYVDIYVYGDDDKYYPVTISGASSHYGYQKYHVSRRYNWTAPSTWNNSTHQGALSLTWEHGSDTAWGGNDKEWRVIQFDEVYSNLCNGLILPVTEGMVVWLRGGGTGGARYRVATPQGAGATVKIYDNKTSGYAGNGTHIASTTFTAGNGTAYAAESYSSSNVDSRIKEYWPIRGKTEHYRGQNQIFAAIDEDNFASNSATRVPTQQSTKAYISSFTPTTATTASNAMLLDGLDSTAFLRSNTADTFSGNLIGTAIVRTGTGTSPNQSAASLNPNGIVTSQSSNFDLIEVDSSNNRLRVFTGSTGTGILNFPTTGNSNYAWTLPLATGTIALTSQITGTNSGTNTGDQDLSGYFLKIGGELTGDLRVTNGDNNGIRFHSGGANITSVASGDVVIQRLTNGLRFGNSASWDYNVWAGIKYDNSTTDLNIGGPAAAAFTSNSNPPLIDINFVGVDNVYADGNLSVGLGLETFGMIVPNQTGYFGMKFIAGDGAVSSDTPLMELKNPSGNFGEGVVQIYSSGSTVLDIQGSQGQLFSVTDDLTGTLFAVSDISGVPVFGVNANGTSSFDGRVEITEGLSVTGTLAATSLVGPLTGNVTGNLTGNVTGNVTGNLTGNVTGNLTGNVTGNASSATNAGTVDGIDSSRIVYGDGVQKVTSTTDFNSRSNPSGFFEQYNGSNAPTSGTWYNMINCRHSNANNSHGFQIAASYYDENIWSRTYSGGSSSSNGTYTTWRRLYHEGHKPTLTELGAASSTHNHDTRYLRLDAANSGVRIASGDGNSLRFWDSTNYMIYMSSTGNSTYGGRVPGETSSDYNMYFKMTGGTNRGFVFRNNTNNVAGIDSVGNGRFKGDVIAYASSDRRYKDNLVTIGNATEKVKQLSGYEFTWNNKQTVYPENTKDIGVVAQEVEKVLPELVTTRESGYKAVKYDKLTALLIEAVKEQQKQIDELKDLVMNLKNKK